MLRVESAESKKFGAAMAAILIAIGACPAGSRAEAASTSHAVECSSILTLVADHAAFTLATPVAAGEFITPTGAKIPGLPAFCRVAARVTPRPTSDIKLEIWLPEQWNHKFLGTGNGGMGGAIDYHALADGLLRGYAVANTDMGTSAGIDSMIGNFDKIVDFGHRSTHVMTVLAKVVISRFYAASPTHSYFRGCSTGGGQGLHEAQRYPDDYDGILAGAPGANRVPAHLAYQWAYAATHRDLTTYLPPEKRKLWADRVMVACDGLDGLKDGLIVRPDKCTIDPAEMQCQGKDATDCLTAGQVDALRKIYAGPRHAVTGEQLAPGYLHGTELGFSSERPTPTSQPPFPFPFQWLWGKDWNWRTFNFGTDADVMRNALNFAVDATNPDLEAFAAHGGKLILYQGLADNIQIPGAVAAYLERVEATMPGQSSRFIKLFQAPGMGHCGGGSGPNVFGNLNPAFPPSLPPDPANDLMAALEQWVEKQREPLQVIATKFAGNLPTGRIERTMPLCAWPKVSRFNGSGNVNDAASFHCANPD
jgi:Tannase and feruloyl esterase